MHTITVYDAEGNELPGSTLHTCGRLIDCIKLTLHRAGSLKKALKKGKLTITVVPVEFKE